MPKPILIVDDDRDDSDAVRRMLAKAKILNPLHFVADGKRAICYLKGEAPYADREGHEDPALVLLDLKLPGKSGLEVLSWIRSQPRHRVLCVVVLTGVNDIGAAGAAYRLGANSFLTKPVATEEFMNLVRGLKEIRLMSTEYGHMIDCETEDRNPRSKQSS